MMWFVVAFLRKRRPELGEITESYVWDDLEHGWAEVTGTAYRTYEEAVSIGVFAAATMFDRGNVKIMSLAELDDYYYDKKLG
jgi:hypothetical protein